MVSIVSPMIFATRASVLAAPNYTLLDPSKQPRIAIPEGDHIFETQPADLVGFLYPTG
jgi:hypothetical protein